MIVRVLLVCWALGYGSLRAYWAAGHLPYVPPLGSDLLALSGWGVVTLCTAAGLVGVVSGARWLPRAARWVVAAAGALTAVVLVAAPFLLLLDVVALVFPGLGLPFSALGLASRIGCLAGGLLTAYVTRSALRDLRGVCARCGRAAGSVSATRTPRWAVTAAAVAIAACVTRFVTQGVVGFSAVPGAYSQAAVAGLAFVAAAALAGTVLPAALVHPWGRRLPRWLLLVPAAFIAAGMTTYFGVGTVQLALEGAGPSAAEVGLPPWFLWVAEPAYLVWGLGLGIATVSYWLRTRPACSACGATSALDLAEVVAQGVGDEVRVDRG